jgi:hypothetical protein
MYKETEREKGRKRGREEEGEGEGERESTYQLGAIEELVFPWGSLCKSQAVGSFLGVSSFGRSLLPFSNPHASLSTSLQVLRGVLHGGRKKRREGRKEEKEGGRKGLSLMLPFAPRNLERASC